MTHRVRAASIKRGLDIGAQGRALIKRAALEALLRQQADLPCEVNVLYTDDAGIRRINLGQRGVDKPTDVLSFPLYDFVPGMSLRAQKPEKSPESGRVWLGDIVISAETLRRQANEYGHGENRELAFLTVHGMMHLLGWDHTRGADEERAMFDATERILQKLGLELAGEGEA